MFLCDCFYVDESGTGLGDKRSPYFVLSAIGIPTSEWQLIDEQVAALKRRLVSYAEPEDFEIKGRDLRRGEKFFKDKDWAARIQAFHEIAQLIADFPCHIFTVQVDKRHLPEFIGSDDQMYRLAMGRLLEAIDAELHHLQEPGMLLFDMRSDMHSSVQDRRLVDSYRQWVKTRPTPTNLIELPWFGFSSFYAGLQLADFAAYLIDFVSNDESSDRGKDELKEAFARFQPQVRLLHIP